MVGILPFIVYNSLLKYIKLQCDLKKINFFIIIKVLIVIILSLIWYNNNTRLQ